MKSRTVGAQIANAIVQIGNVRGEFLARQRLDRYNAAVLHELLLRAGADDLFDAHQAKNLHGALVDHRRTRMDRGAAVMLHHHGLHAVVGQQQRGGHAHQAAACDQNGDFEVRHRQLSTSLQVPMRSYLNSVLCGIMVLV